MLKKIKLNYILIVLLVILTIPSFWFLVLPGFVSTDDGNWMIIRFSAFYQALVDGQIPVRFLPRLNFGYGYPVANFLYPGFMYLAVPFKLLGLSFTETIKVVIGLSMVASGVFVFMWLNKLFDNISSFFASLLYVYLPYHLYDLSKRGSAGELLSLAVGPFVLWQIERQSIFFTSIGFAVLILSHNTLAILFSGFIVIYVFLLISIQKNKKPLLDFFKRVALFGLGLSAFFWIPAILELPNTVFNKTKISNFKEYFADYNLVGIPTIVMTVAVLCFFIFRTELIKKHRLTLLALIISLLSMFFASSLSSPFWDFLPVSFIQFPFRVLSITLVASAVICAFLLSQISLKYRIAVGIVIVLFTVFISKDYLIPKNFNLEPDSFYATNEATTTVEDEYMPIWVKHKPSSRYTEKVEIFKGEGKINNVVMNGGQVNFDYVSNSPSVVQVNTIYYPGWKAYSDSKEKAIFYDNEGGLINIKLPEGDHSVKLSFTETPLRLFSDLISLLSFVSLVVYVNKEKIAKLFKK